MCIVPLSGGAVVVVLPIAIILVGSLIMKPFLQMGEVLKDLEAWNLEDHQEMYATIAQCTNLQFAEPNYLTTANANRIELIDSIKPLWKSNASFLWSFVAIFGALVLLGIGIGIYKAVYSCCWLQIEDAARRRRIRARQAEEDRIAAAQAPPPQPPQPPRLDPNRERQAAEDRLV